MRLFICGSYAVASDHAVFPVAVNKKKEKKEPSMFISFSGMEDWFFY
jgi:hypothetical protein